MELWTCTVEGYIKEHTLLGIFSTKEQAKTQAEVFMQGVDMHFEMIDHANEGIADEVLYYETKRTQETFTFYIERYILNELSY